jgi:hypothetical protein
VIVTTIELKRNGLIEGRDALKATKRGIADAHDELTQVRAKMGIPASAGVSK